MDDRETSHGRQTFAEKQRHIKQGAIAKEKTEIDSRSRLPRKQTIESFNKAKTDIRSKYSDLAIFKSPLCLIKNDENGKLSIEKQVLEEISKIEDTVNVIAIAGPYRTGKSYLLNRLAGVKNGFHLGHTTKAATKGIWAWCLEHPKRQNEVMMLLDTEGIGDVSKGDKENDDNILCLTTLLTGTFVFNMFGVLDENHLQNMSFVAQLSEKIVLTNAEPEEIMNINPEIGFFFPEFVLCLRDFSLKMKDDETPDEYLEKCLEIKSGNGKNVQEYNVLRLSIIEHFIRRKCFIFDRPAERDYLEHLEELPLEQLSKAFKQDTEKFLAHIYRCEPKKLMDGSHLNGRMFSSLVEQYIEAIRSDKLPCIDEAWTVMSRKENQVAVKTAVDTFQQEINSLGLPLPADFELKYQIMQRFALQQMRNMVVLDDEQEFQRKAEMKMDTIKDKVVLENKDFVQKKCRREMQTLFDEMIKPKLSKGKYLVQDGYYMYKEDFARMREQVKLNLYTADSNLVQMFAIEFEKSNQKHDVEILSKVNMIGRETKRKMEDKLLELEREKLKLNEQVKIKRKQDKAVLKLYKKELTLQREEAKKEISDQYAKMVLEWQKMQLELLQRLEKQDNLIKEIRENQNEKAQNQNEKAQEKSSVGQTVMKIMDKLIPYVAPVACELLRSVLPKTPTVC